MGQVFLSTDDDLLTLVAMAKEMKSRGLKEADIALAVGLPLTRFILHHSSVM